MFKLIFRLLLKSVSSNKINTNFMNLTNQSKIITKNINQLNLLYYVIIISKWTENSSR